MTDRWNNIGSSWGIFMAKVQFVPMDKF